MCEFVTRAALGETLDVRFLKAFTRPSKATSFTVKTTREMATARNKIVKPEGVVPDELELQVAQNIFDLEQNQELKADLRGLQITAAKEVCI